MRTDGVVKTTTDRKRQVQYQRAHDVETDLNTPRPIVAGGTGATSADDALTSLKAEKYAQVVSNWDSMSWMAGSFYAPTTASGASPFAGHAFAGIAYMANATDFVLDARDMTDSHHIQYTRVMSGGVWGAWSSSGFYAAPFDALAYNGMQVNGSSRRQSRTRSFNMANGFGVGL